MSAIQRDYDNAKNREQILDELDEGSEDSELSGENASQEELFEARETVSSEPQPDSSGLPGLASQEIEWRGSMLEFNEGGDMMQEIAEMEADDDTTEAELRTYVNGKLAELCTNPAADVEYWSQFDTIRGDDIDGILDLILRMNGDMTLEDIQESEKFRNQS